MNTIGKATNFTITSKPTSTSITWTDPEDIVVDGLVTDFWTCTKILRKTTGYPTSITDGIVVVSSTVRNQYQEEPFVDYGLEQGTTYYYSAFTIGSHVNDVSFNRESCVAEAFVASYKTMTVNINFNQSNPTKMCTYADDAVGAPCGLNEEATAFWQEFFGYRPCLFKEGAVVGYLNPNDYTKFEDGSSAKITSSTYGDVMIEYPRRGVKFSKSGKVVTISVTDNPDASGFTYYAHTRGSTRRESFYLCAYLGYVSGYRIYGNSGKTNTVNISLETFREKASWCGDGVVTGYTIMTFYQYLYIQIMYCFQFSNNLNSQEALGRGWNTSNNPEYTRTSGTANNKGLVYGTPGRMGDIKLFGLENPWGVCYQWVDGFYTTSSGAIMTATDGFNNTGSGYITRQTGRSTKYGTPSDIEGTAELGFIATSSGFSGSTTTYLCDFESLTFTNSFPVAWGCASTHADGGIFCFECNNGYSSGGSRAGVRFAY